MYAQLGLICRAMSSQLASAHMHTQSFFIYVTVTEKHNFSARVRAANTKMHLDNFDTGTQKDAQKYVHQAQHVVNRSISKINKYMSFHLAHKLTQHDISSCSEEHWRKEILFIHTGIYLGAFFF